MENQIIKNKKVLVTGGAGFIGSNLCRTLLDQGNEVVCLDNFSTGYRSNIEPLFSDDNFLLLEGDIRNYEDCKQAVKGCDYVLHQAALGSVPRSIKDPMTTAEVNIGGFVNILHAAAEEGVTRFVYAASSSTYGDHKGLPKVEHIIGKPLSPYGITKYIDEVFAGNFSALYGIETIGLRYFNVYGRLQSPLGAYAAVIPKFVIQLINHEQPVINCDGSFSRDFTYIDNVIQANQRAAVTPSEVIREKQKTYYQSISAAELTPAPETTISEIFNVACGESTSLAELVNILKSELQEFDPAIEGIMAINGPQRAGDIPHSLASIEKIKQVLGYQPMYDIRKGLKEATQWYWNNYR